MLYTLIGNGTANTKEVLASLTSLKNAVPEDDDFWMCFLDPTSFHEEPSSTLEGILGWVQGLGIYHESVLAEGIDPSPSLKAADETHIARRPLDFIVKLTKGRLQPGESSAILVLSDKLDDDEASLYAIERAIADDIPVYDLAGQMVQVLLEDEAPDMEPLPAEAAALDEDEEMTLSITVTKESEQWRHEDGSVRVDHMDSQPGDYFGTPADLPQSQPLVFSRELLDDLTRDELKHLVRTQILRPDVLGAIDLRSKESMIAALLALQEGDADTATDTATDSLATVSSITTPLAAPSTDGFHYYVRILSDGTPMITPLSQDVIDLLLTLMADA